MLDDVHFSYLEYEPNMFLPELLRTKYSFIAYDRGNSYCERKNTAKIDIISRRYQNGTRNPFVSNIISILLVVKKEMNFHIANM